jgi:hypothetical protein
MGLSYGDDYEYARRNLVGSVVLHNGKPCNIIEIGGGKVRAYYLYNEKIFIDNLNSFNINAFRLGYVNYPDCARYVSRIPARQWRQGLTRQTLACLNGGMVGLDKYLVPTILNQYPNYHVCIEQVIEEDKIRSKAFSRSFAICVGPRKDLPYLIHKENPVGMVVDGEIVLNKDKLYLKENLTKDMYNGH